MPSAADPGLEPRPWLLALGTLGALAALLLIGVRLLPFPWPVILGTLLLLGVILLVAVSLVGHYMGLPFGILARLEGALLGWVARFSRDPGAFHFAWAVRSPSLEKARERLLLAADRGHREAMREVGRDYLDGTHGSAGRGAAVPWLARAAQLGDAEAAFWLGEAHRWGMVATGGRPAAHQAYLQAARAGHRPAALWLAHAFAAGDGVAADEVQARAWAERAATLPGPDAPGPGLLRRLAERVSRLQQVAGEFSEAFDDLEEILWAQRWFQRVTWSLLAFFVLLGSFMVLALPLTRLLLATLVVAVGLAALLMRLYGFGPQRIGRDTLKLEARAQAGDPAACFELGMRFERGHRDLPRDAMAARHWYRRAVDLGHGMALLRLADLLAWGLGGARDRGEARRLLERARALGLAEAEAVLARMAPELGEATPAAEDHPAETTP